MRYGISLPAKIFLIALLNILLIALALVLFARLEFQFDLGNVLLSSARERIVSTSRMIALQLPETPRAQWAALLKQFEGRYPAQFYLFADDGSEMAGEPAQPPPKLFAQLPRPPMPPREPADTLHSPMIDGPPEAPPPPPPPHAPHRPREAAVSIIKATGAEGYWAAVRIPIWTPGNWRPYRAVLVWRFSDLWTDSFYFDYRPWLTAVSVVLVISALCWFPLVRGLTNSIASVTTATGRIADGQFNTHVPVTRRDELGRLGQSINRMTERLAGYVYGQKRFLGDVAHELSSPIARMQMAVGVLENRARAEDSAYVADVREDLEQMAELVSELLSFSKAQVTQGAVQVSAVNVAAAVHRVVERESIRGASFDVKVSERLYVFAHPELLRRALANVVRNAIRYAGAAGAIEIAAVQVNDQVRITIADQGPGIPESELENVFRPFYRPEFARTRETGGTGLGLAIVRDCVEACGGRVFCRNLSPHGLEVTLEFRVAAQPESESQPQLAASSSVRA